MQANEISGEVNRIFLDCLFSDEEIASFVDGQPGDDVVIKVDSILYTVGFNKLRLESHRAKVEEILREMPEGFFAESGGGHSFLNLCDTKTGEQWTGLHKVMSQLCELAIGLDVAQWTLPREMWEMFPGSMPYFTIKIPINSPA